MCTRAGSGHRLAPTAQQEMPPHCRQRRLSRPHRPGPCCAPWETVYAGVPQKQRAGPPRALGAGRGGRGRRLPSQSCPHLLFRISAPTSGLPLGGGGPRGLSVLVLMDGGVPPPNPREQAAEAQTGGAGVRRLGAGREKSWLGRGLHWLRCQDRVPSRSHGAPDAEREPRRRAHRVRPQQRGIPGLGASWSPPEAKTEA